MSISLDYPVIMSRAQAGYEAERGKIEPQGFTLFKILACASGIAIACASEAYSATIAFETQYEALSDGTDLGHDMSSMRICIVAALLLTHGFLHDDGDSRPFRRWLRRMKVLPVLAILGGVAVFSFTAVSNATGGEDGKADIAGLAIGIACGALFMVSFFACNALMNKFLPALRTFIAGHAQRAKVKALARDLEATDACRANIAGLRRDIAARTPEALQRKVAAEAASIVGRVAAEAHDLHASREAVGDDRRPEDELNGVPDVPLASLERLRAHLAQFDFQFFLNLLRTHRKES